MPKQSKAGSPTETSPIHTEAVADTRKRRKSSKQTAAKPESTIRPEPIKVRDRFTMPENDYARIGKLKKRVRKLGASCKKNELLRLGLQLLSELPDDLLLARLAALRES